MGSSQENTEATAAQTGSYIPTCFFHTKEYYYASYLFPLSFKFALLCSVCGQRGTLQTKPHGFLCQLASF